MPSSKELRELLRNLAQDWRNRMVYAGSDEERSVYPVLADELEAALTAAPEQAPLERDARFLVTPFQPLAQPPTAKQAPEQEAGLVGDANPKQERDERPTNITSDVENVPRQATNSTQDVKVLCPNCRRDITESPSYCNREHLLGFCVPGKLHYDEYLTEMCEEGRHENCGGSPVFRWHNQSWGTYGIQVCPCQCHKEQLGKLVREQWVRWAYKHPQPKPHWLLPYEKLNESDKEADRQIGEGLLRKFLDWIRTCGEKF